jgi:putative colanic acid biosysnthesis UDP-glucose lipid carrier transferase
MAKHTESKPTNNTWQNRIGTATPAVLWQWEEPVETQESSSSVVVMPPWPLDKQLNRWCKRAADIFISLLVILLIFPWLIPLLAVWIAVDSRGPVFFRQKRTGRHGRSFYCLKLRTMYANVHADLAPALHNDPRITRAGRFLRSHYLDELPQFFNVLLGQMSVVGPRPHMLSDEERFARITPTYYLRQQVKPGITGLAQVNGLVGADHSEPAIKKRLYYDVQYLRSWTFGLDMRILFKTITRLFR